MNGIYRDLSFADYLGDPAYGNSDLSTFRKGPPAMVQWRRHNRSKGTDATRLGSAAHCYILQPEDFKQAFVLKPEGMEFRSNENKAKRDAWLAAGLEILTQNDMATVEAVAAAFNARRAVAATLRSAKGVESSIFWQCRHTGLPCKSRPDWFTSTAVYDLKVSIDAERDSQGVVRAAYRNGWMHQAANAREALRENGFPEVRRGRLVICSSLPPHEHKVWSLDISENDLDVLELENINTRRRMVEHHETGDWPGHPDQWLTIELPKSAADDITESDLIGAEEAES